MRRLIIRLLIVSIIVGLNINPGYSQLLINEILSSNITVSRDPQFYNYGDWIEIYNAGSSSVNLYNYRVTDDINYPDKYIIDYSIYIGAHSYKIIWADQEDYNLHTNFSLDSDGEFIALVSPGGTIVDSITYKKQIPDVSYGRYPDGSSNWVYFGEPTQESSNSSPGPADLTQAPDVGFSAAPGFYSSSQSIELSTSSPSAAIHYTTDGSVPDENSTIYSSPVVVSSTTVIRAKSYESGYLPGKICVSTYFINESFDIPVVSLSTDPDNFFSGSYGIFVEGWNGVVGWCREEPANWFRDWERPINFEYYEPDGERKINQLVGAKLAGKCSRNWPSKSIALISREKYGQKGIYYKFFNDKDNTYFKSIVLRNSGNDFEKTMLRDGFMQNLLIGRMDIDYQEYQPAVVFLNGEYWGILNLREKINEHYAESNYGINSDSVSVMEKNLVLLHGTDEHYLNMLDYINSHNLGVQENFDYVSTQMDVNEYMDYFIFNIFINNGDWPQNNIKYWRENNSTGRW